MIGSSLPPSPDHYPSPEIINKEEVIQASVYLRPAEPFPDAIDRTKPIGREEIRLKHGVKIEDLNKVNEFAQVYGLKSKLSDLRRVILTGTIRQFEQAFEIALVRYVTPSGIVYLTHFENLSMPECLEERVVAVLGLDNRPLF